MTYFFNNTNYMIPGNYNHALLTTTKTWKWKQSLNKPLRTCWKPLRTCWKPLKTPEEDVGEKPDSSVQVMNGEKITGYTEDKGVKELLKEME